VTVHTRNDSECEMLRARGEVSIISNPFPDSPSRGARERRLGQFVAVDPCSGLRCPTVCQQTWPPVSCGRRMLEDRSADRHIDPWRRSTMLRFNCMPCFTHTSGSPPACWVRVLNPWVRPSKDDGEAERLQSVRVVKVQGPIDLSGFSIVGKHDTRLTCRTEPNTTGRIHLLGQAGQTAAHVELKVEDFRLYRHDDLSSCSYSPDDCYPSVAGPRYTDTPASIRHPNSIAVPWTSTIRELKT
jgi:hypothetical protein